MVSENEERLARVLEGLTECLSGLRSSWSSDPPKNQNLGGRKEVNEVNFTPTYPYPPKVTNVPQNTGCFQCRKPGHFRRNCSEFLRQKSDNDTPIRGSLRGTNLLDKASVYVQMKLSGVEVPCLMDNGCEITMVPRRLVQRHGIPVTPTEQRIYAANGSEIELSGEAMIPFVLNDRRMDTFAVVSPDVEEVMIGSDWLEAVSYTHLTLPTNREV